MSDREVLRIIKLVVNKRLIDLQHVNEKPLEVGLRRVAGAEIIKRELDTEFAASMNYLRNLCHFRQSRALQHLYLQLRGIHALMCGKQVMKTRREVRMLQLLG